MFSDILDREKLCCLTHFSGSDSPLLPKPMGHFDTRKLAWFPKPAIRGLDITFYSYLNWVLSKRAGP